MELFVETHVRSSSLYGMLVFNYFLLSYNFLQFDEFEGEKRGQFFDPSGS
jgi:hypothetical protein